MYKAMPETAILCTINVHSFKISINKSLEGRGEVHVHLASAVGLDSLLKLLDGNLAILDNAIARLIMSYGKQL
jgi:hypothetical protein